MSTKQDRSIEQQPLEPDPLPPNTLIIESSCESADSRTEDFSKWTTILREPVLVNKGSEIRIESNFIDSRGMTEDIIQFNTSGDDQSNTHRLLTHLYVTNDGFNNKTCSYDYMARETEPFIINQIQGGYDLTQQTPVVFQYIDTTNTQRTLELSPNGAPIDDVLNLGQFGIQQFQITNAGQNYRNGMRFTLFKSPVTTAYEGFIQTNDVGSIINMYIDVQGITPSAVTFDETDITFNDPGIGEGVVFTASANILNYIKNVVIDNAIDIINATYGTSGNIQQLNSGGGVIASTSVTLGQLTTNTNGINNIASQNYSYMDPGYNYQKVPLYRWAQTFDINDNFSYGFGLGDRTYTKGDGTIITIQNPLPLHSTDYCLSSGDLLMNREDEFVSGVFHTASTNKEFVLHKPIARIDAVSGHQLLWINYTCQFQCPVINTTQHNKTLTSSLARAFPLGQTIKFHFGVENSSGEIITPTIDILTALSPIIDKCGGEFQVGEIITSGNQGRVNNEFLAIGCSPETINPNITGPVSIFDFFIDGPSNSAFPPNSNTPLTLIYQGTDNPNTTAPTSSIVINAAINGNGNIEPDGSTIQDSGAGHFPGNYYTIDGYAGNDVKFYLLSVDNCNTSGPPMAFNEPFEFTQSNLEFNVGSDTYTAVPYVVPTNLYDRQGGKGKQPSVQPKFGAVYDVVDQLYPANFDTQFILEARDIPPPALNTGLVEERISTAMYRYNGEFDKTDPNFDTKNSAYVNHSPDCDFSVVNNSVTTNANIKSINASYGTSSDLIYPYGDITNNATDWLFSGSFEFRTLRINKALWDASYQLSDLPINAYVVIQETTDSEQHILTGGISSDGTYYYIKIICSNCNASHSNLKILGTGGSTFMGYQSLLDVPSFNISQNGKSYTSINIRWITNYLDCNSSLVLQWGDGTANNKTNTGSGSLTAEQNFFGSQDINLPILEEINPVVSSFTDDFIQTYDNGGYYFFTHFKQALTNSENSQTYNFGKQQRINDSGIPVFLTSKINSVYQNIPFQDRLFFNTSSQVTNIDTIYGYEPMLRDKTFTINKNYALPSDISAVWTNQAHDLQGAINLSNGQTYVDQNKSGLLQNEFCFPVYGSNNRISNEGKYIIDLDLHPHTGGYEAGHVVGISYLDDDNSWLTPEIKYNLPKDSDQNSFYYVFFRTPFTFIRSYDCLAITQDGKPDRTPLSTIEQSADKIGNTGDLSLYGDVVGNLDNAITSAGTGYVKDGVYGFYKDLSGTISGTQIVALQVSESGGLEKFGIVKMDSSQAADQTNIGLNIGITESNPTSPATITIGKLLKDIRCFELGLASGRLRSDTQKGFESQSTTYPIYYLDEEKKSLYPKAKASQYVGSPNVTLAFDTGISTFTFQFLHAPFTSPFVDGNGGDTSIRIFYGNRKEGIYNHDTLSGLNVLNYCRPDYPNGVFTFDEVQNNYSNILYPNGINPLTSVSENGRNFLNKLGFTDTNLSIKKISNKYQIDYSLGTLGYIETQFTKNITTEFKALPPSSSISITSKNYIIQGTTGSNIDVSDSILTSIPAPEISAGLGSFNKRLEPLLGSITRVQKWGDMIYYPYSVSTQTNTFQDASLVRFDNASTTNGSIGGLLMSNTSRGMGLPNTQGSTFLTDDFSIPRTLNPDGNIYISYTVSCGSSEKRAELLPTKLENGFLCVLSSVMRDTPLYLSGINSFVNGMAIISKAFVTGDFIYSAGQLSFYAKEDYYLSEITTSIVTNQLKPPTTLGEKSSVIYSITNYNPKPMDMLPTTLEEQMAASIRNEALEKEMKKIGRPQESGIKKLHDDLLNLGVLQLRDPGSDMINTLRDQINHYDIPNMTQKEKTEFMKTPEGKAFTKNATDVAYVNQKLDELNQAFDRGEDTFDLSQEFEDEMRSRSDRVRERAEQYPLPQIKESEDVPISTLTPVMASGPAVEPSPPPRRRRLQRPTPTRTSIIRGQTPPREPEEGKIYRSNLPGLLNKDFESPEQLERSESIIQRFRDEKFGIRPKGKRGKPTQSQREKLEDVEERMNRFLDTLTDSPPQLQRRRRFTERKRVEERPRYRPPSPSDK